MSGFTNCIVSYAPQAPCSGSSLQRELRYRGESLVGEGEVYLVVAEELPVLAHQSVLGFGEDSYQIRLLKAAQRGDHRQAPDELGDEAVAQEVLRQRELQDGVELLLDARVDVAPETDVLLTDALPDDLLQASERAAADE
jgi:hypothetical protein